MNYRPKGLFLLFFVFLTIATAQEQIGFRQLSIADGLSQNCGISITQDSTGYLWIATQDGLNRYDGTTFTKFPFIFSDITRPTYSRLGKVFTDRDGQIWCIPNSHKLYRLDASNSEFKSVPGYTDTSIFYQDSDGRYWTGTYGKGLRYFRMQGGQPIEKGSLAISQNINAISETGGSILAATDKGVYEIDRATAHIIDSVGSVASGAPLKQGISTISIGPGGTQWFGTYGQGLYFRSPKDPYLQSASELPLSGELPENLNILSLFTDSKGRLWVGTYGEGLFLMEPDKKSVTQFKADKHNKRAIHYNDILSIYEDYTGTLWFGTDGAGLSYYDEYLEKFNSIINNQVPEDIHVDVVRAIERDTLGSVWIGTSGKGLMQYDLETDTWKKYTAGKGSGQLRSDRIMSLFHDGSDLWVGTQGGGLSLIRQEGQILNYIDNPAYGLEAITIWDIHQDKMGRTWLATREYGLLEFDKYKGVRREFNARETAESPVFENIRVITEARPGEFWLGGVSEGLIRINPDTGSFQHYVSDATEGGLPDNRIKSLYYDPADKLWVGTNGSGLAALDPKTDQFTVYTEKDGLANNVIYAVLPDGHGHLWLSSNRGISRFGLAPERNDSPEIVNYTNYEGLATEFNTGASFKYRDGTLYFGGLEGFYWFRPETIENNPHLPKTTITGIQIADEALPLTEGQELDSRANTLTFTFSGMQYSLPEEIEYRYRLVDYDEDWVYAGHTPFARYSFLPPGTYEFQVVASNYDGVWNPEPATFGFTIAPPWYASTEARLVYAAILLLLIAGIYFYLRTRWRMKLDLKLKEAETLRLKELNEFKSKLYSDISHEIRTPLSLISAPVEARLKEGGLNKTEHSRFSLINRNVKRITALVDQMLHLTRLEQGKLILKPEADDASLFLRVLVRAFEYPAKKSDIDFKWAIADTGRIWFDSDVLEKIVSNLLSNALKYCPQGGRCRFRAQMEGGSLQLHMSNTVQDPKSIDLDQLFSRFYQGDATSEGSGIGLALVKELVSLSKGQIDVHISGSEIHFRVELPVKTAAQPIQTSESLQDGETPETSSSESGDRAKEELPIVLIAEDHDELRDYLQKAWQETYRVYACRDGSEALRTALKYVPDLVLTDIRMPGIGGIELCNQLKTDERTSHIPVILFTSGAAMEQELRGLEAGADDYVTKPFQLAVLQKRIDNLIQTRRDLQQRYSQQHILKAQDIAITPADEVFLNRVQQVLDEHLNDAEFNATIFARKVGMSRMQLHRKLQAYTGLSTTAFVRSQRLKQATELLKKADLAVSEVAYAVGFNTPSYFIKCFRETYGTTPAEFS